jgi:glycosyltransferase involved in cell wall biosynthesis
MTQSNLCFIVEASTDVRLVEGLADRFNLTIIHRQIDQPFISQPTDSSFKTITGPASRLKFAQFVFNHLRQAAQTFDYVIVQSYSLAALAANLAARLTHIPTAMLVCSPIEAYYQCRKTHSLPGKPFRQHELLGMRTIAIANAIVGQQYLVLSQHLADVVIQYGIRKPITFLPLYGVDTTLFKPANLSKSELKVKMGLPTTGKLIFFSSRIAPEKDSETLLQAFRQLLDEGQDLWLLHRSGGYKSFLADAETYGVADRIIATDAVHPHRDLPADYQACDLCIQSSREEGLGFSPLEALACETPVIASAVGGLRETIDVTTGWSYPVGDVAKLSACIREVIANPEAAHQRAQTGRELVQKVYDRTLIFDRLSDIVSATTKKASPLLINTP